VASPDIYFKGALAEEDISIEEKNVIEVGSNQEMARIACLDFLSKRKKLPSAFFTSRDVRAAGLYSACRELGLSIPDQISVISYDNITWSSAEAVGLTTVRENAEEMGEAAVDMLAEWVLNKKRPPNRVFGGELLIRESCKDIT
jgi:LacI family transcriptional regulator